MQRELSRRDGRRGERRLTPRASSGRERHAGRLSLDVIPGISTHSGWPACANRRGTVLSPFGLEVPARCDLVSCPSCITPVALRTSEAIAMAQPNAMLTITGLVKEWFSAKRVMQSLRRKLRHHEPDGAWAFHLEVNPKRTGAHAHVWWRGPDIQVELLHDLALRSGAREEVFVRPAFVPPGTRIPALPYGLKAILDDRPDTAEKMWPAAQEYLDLNGGGLVHASQGFWTDWKGDRVEGALERARVMAHGWRGGRPHTEFLREWRESIRRPGMPGLALAG